MKKAREKNCDHAIFRAERGKAKNEVGGEKEEGQKKKTHKAQLRLCCYGAKLLSIDNTTLLRGTNCTQRSNSDVEPNKKQHDKNVGQPWCV